MAHIEVGDIVVFIGSTAEFEVVGVTRNGKTMFLRDGYGPLVAEVDKLEVVKKGAEGGYYGDAGSGDQDVLSVN